VFYAVAAYVVHLALLIVTCVFCFRWGGTTEKRGALTVVLATALTFAVSWWLERRSPGFRSGVFIVDLMAWGSFLYLALHSDRFWPIWATAFQSIGVILHVAVSVDPGVVPKAYAIGQGLWSFPIFLVMLLASERCRQEKKRMRYSAWF
jgi:hypothetical protein